MEVAEKLNRRERIAFIARKIGHLALRVEGTGPKGESARNELLVEAKKLIEEIEG